MLRILQIYFFIAIVAMAIAPAGTFAATLQAATLRVESGTRLSLELDTPMTTAAAKTGDVVWFRLRSVVFAGDRVAIPLGTRVRAELDLGKTAAGNSTQNSEIQIWLQEIFLDKGGRLRLSASVLKVAGRRSSTSSVGAVPQGLPGQLLSSVLSSVARGGRSTAIGVAVAVLTTATTARQRRPTAPDIDVPIGSPFEAILERDLDIPDPDQPPPARPDTASASAPAYLAPYSKTDAPIPATPDSTAPDGAIMLKVDVDLVHVDAIVRDRRGIPMTGLRQEDFRIFEDGVEQQIQKLSREYQPLAVALIIDWMGVNGSHSLYRGPWGPKLVAEGGPAYQLVKRLQPGDAVSLFTLSGPYGVELREPMTTDHQRLVERIAWLPYKTGLGSTFILDSLQEAVHYLDTNAPEQRHAVILITQHIEGRSHASAAQVLQLAGKTNAAIYAIELDFSSDGNGVLVGVSIPGVGKVFIPQNISDPVPSIVKKTGGELFALPPGELLHIDGVALGSALAKAIGRLRPSYTLSYAPANHPNGAYHRIEVRLADRFGKPTSNYTIHSQTGYYGTAAHTTVPPGR